MIYIYDIYMIQTEINNFCISDLFHEYNHKLHYRPRLFKRWIALSTR